MNVLIKLDDYTNKILNLVKAKYELKGKEDAIKYVVTEFVKSENKPLFDLPILNSEQIMKILEENKIKIKSFSVKKLGLFGSYAKGEASDKSDLDFLVVLKENNFDNYFGLKVYLEELLKKRVDLVIEKDLRSELEYVKEEALYVKGL